MTIENRPPDRLEDIRNAVRSKYRTVARLKRRALSEGGSELPLLKAAQCINFPRVPFKAAASSALYTHRF